MFKNNFLSDCPVFAVLSGVDNLFFIGYTKHYDFNILFKIFPKIQNTK